MDLSTIFSIAFFLFLLMDAIGNVPLYISVLKKFSPARQRVIIVREMLIALGLIIVFLFIGDALLSALNISDEAVQIAGGIILLIICLQMVFPKAQDHHETSTEEPFVVPLAIPFVAGPAVLAAIIIYARQHINPLVMIISIIVAWIPSLIILLGASYLKNILGNRGISAVEKLMGLLLTLIAVQMFLTGFHTFSRNQQQTLPVSHCPITK